MHLKINSIIKWKKKIGSSIKKTLLMIIVWKKLDKIFKRNCLESINKIKKIFPKFIKFVKNKNNFYQND